MKRVVDVNVVLSSLVKKGVAFKVFAINSFLRKFRFFTPDFLLSEFEKHKEDIFKESKLSRDVFLDIIELNIKVAGS